MIAMSKSILKAVCFLIVSLALIGGAMAFSVQVASIDDAILPLESASYNVTLSNERSTADVVQISADATNWIITPQAISLPPNGTVSVKMFITPRSGVGLSNYRIPVSFESSRTGQVVDKSIYLSLGVDILTKGYPPNVRLNVTSESVVDPRKPFDVSVFLRNHNLRDYASLVVSVQSDLFYENVTAPLQPLATYRKKFLFDLDPYLAPGKYSYKVMVATPDGTVISQDESSIEVIGYAALEADREVTERGFLKSLEVITVRNEGNKELTKAVTYKVNWFEDLFLKATPKGEVVHDEMGRKLSWTPTLAPEEERQIVLQRNYIPLAIIILALILAVLAYFRLRSPIISIKQAQITAADKEGVHEMKVRVLVKNRSRVAINKLKVIDRVPHIAEFIENKHLGTLQPTKVTKSERRGTIVRWEIDSLEPYEERIISYKIHSKLKIIGRMSLPETRIKFEQGRGHERVVGSGPAVMVR